MTKASDNEYPSVLFEEQGAAPTTPASGFWRAYFKSDGLYVVDDAGTETGPLAEASGGGGLTQAYLGYNTIGGTTATVTTDLWYLKKISPANACLITDIEFYGAQSTDFGQPFSIGLFSDAAGSPANLLQAGGLNANVAPRESAGTVTPRWFGFPLGRWVTAGDYWIGFAQRSTARWTIYFDGSGSDVTYQAPTDYVLDPTHGTRTVTSNKYSIRANTIR